MKSAKPGDDTQIPLADEEVVMVKTKKRDQPQAVRSTNPNARKPKSKSADKTASRPDRNKMRMAEDDNEKANSTADREPDDLEESEEESEAEDPANRALNDKML